MCVTKGKKPIGKNYILYIYTTIGSLSRKFDYFRLDGRLLLTYNGGNPVK